MKINHRFKFAHIFNQKCNFSRYNPQPVFRL
jgi:hypothetical protein